MDRNDIVKEVKTEKYDKKVWLYEQSGDKVERFVLGERGSNPIICFGINPSTASPNDPDKTMEVVKSVLSNRTEYDGYIMLNIYPQRAKKPSQIDKKGYPGREALIQENLKHIERIFKDNEGGIIWAAWGSSIKSKKYLWDECFAEIVSLAKKHHMVWKTIGGQGNKHPHHPLYNRIENDEGFREIDIDYYLEHGEIKEDERSWKKPYHR